MVSVRGRIDVHARDEQQLELRLAALREALERRGGQVLATRRSRRLDGTRVAAVRYHLRPTHENATDAI